MTTHQNDGDPPFTRDAGRVPLEVLRDFALEQTQLHGYRATAHRWKMGHETLRKFATGRTVHPHPRQRESMGLEFLELHPEGYVRDGTADGRPRALRRLKSLLPPERERAAEVLERIFALAERHPEELPEEAAAVRDWLRAVLSAEFEAEARHPPAQRPPGPGNAPGEVPLTSASPLRTRRPGRLRSSEQAAAE